MWEKDGDTDRNASRSNNSNHSKKGLYCTTHPFHDLLIALLRDPKDHMSIKILHSGPKAQNKQKLSQKKKDKTKNHLKEKADKMLLNNQPPAKKHLSEPPLPPPQPVSLGASDS